MCSKRSVDAIASARPRIGERRPLDRHHRRDVGFDGRPDLQRADDRRHAAPPAPDRALPPTSPAPRPAGRRPAPTSPDRPPAIAPSIAVSRATARRARRTVTRSAGAPGPTTRACACSARSGDLAPTGPELRAERANLAGIGRPRTVRRSALLAAHRGSPGSGPARTARETPTSSASDEIGTSGQTAASAIPLAIAPAIRRLVKLPGTGPADHAVDLRRHDVLLGEQLGHRGHQRLVLAPAHGDGSLGHQRVAAQQRRASRVRRRLQRERDHGCHPA